MDENNLFRSEDEQEGPNKEERVLGAMCYILVGFIAPLLMHKESSFISFHVRQGATIFLIYLILCFFSNLMTWGLFTVVYAALAYFAGKRAFEGEMYEFFFMKKLFDLFKKK